MPESFKPKQPSPVVRWTYFSMAWLFFGVGALGTVVPGLPTTPFMLVALWCFSKSSERFRAWLYHHRVFGPVLQQWQQHRVISLPVKLVAWASMGASATYLWWRGDLPWPLITAIGAAMLWGAAYIARFPSRLPPPRADSSG